MDGRIQLFLRDVWLCPVKDSSFIRAGCDAVPATDAPVVVYHHQSVGFLPGGMDRAYFNTRRVLTLLALDGQIDEPFLRDQVRIIIMFGVFEVDQISSLEPENPDPLKLRFISGLIVFFHTGINTSPASNAPGKLETIAPKRIGQSFLGADLKFPPILLQVSLFQLCDDPFLFIRGHLHEAFLQEIFGFLFRAGGENRESQPSQSGQ
jgi:hypothetical protein